MKLGGFNPALEDTKQVYSYNSGSPRSSRLEIYNLGYKIKLF